MLPMSWNSEKQSGPDTWNKEHKTSANFAASTWLERNDLVIPHDQHSCFIQSKKPHFLTFISAIATMASTRLCRCWLRSSFTLFVQSPIYSILLATTFAPIVLGQTVRAPLFPSIVYQTSSGAAFNSVSTSSQRKILFVSG